MSEQQLRVGVVGTGWAGEAHIAAYRQQSGVEVVAIADPRESRLAELAAKYGLAHTYTDYHDLVARDDLDIISVATPNHLHAPVTVAALESGKHVLCEKPLARELAEGETMVRAAMSAKRVLEVAFNHRQRGDVRVLKAHIDQGGLGNIYHAKATWMRRSGIPGMGGWFTTRAMAGGGPLIDLGVHVLDMALYLMGEPEVSAVSAATYAELGPRGRGGRGDNAGLTYEVEDLATAFIRLSNGVTLLLEASWAVYGRHGDDFGVSLFGTEGGADIEVLNYGWQNTLRIYGDTGGVPSVTRPEVTQGLGHAGVVADFLAVVRSGDWAGHNGIAALRRSQIIEACYRSAQAGHELALTDVALRLE
jgi:predicted dehydrogenase